MTTSTVSHIAQIFVPEKREQLGSVVGGYETTRSAIQVDTTTALVVLALISLSLGVINLFPFLPLDGGHIFWALAEKVRGKAIPFSVMERAGFVGFALVIALFLVGLTQRHRPDLQRRLRTPVASPHGGETSGKRRDDRRGLPADGRGPPGPDRGPHAERRDRADVGAAA